MAADEQKSKEWIMRNVELILTDIRSVDDETRKMVPYRIGLATKHHTFFKQFPSILMKLIDDGDDFDMERFNQMLDLMEQVHSGEKDLEETNREIGQEYFDRYVKEKVEAMDAPGPGNSENGKGKRPPKGGGKKL